MMLVMVDEPVNTSPSRSVDRSEGFGERLLGSIVDRAHLMPPYLIAPLIEQELSIVGGRDVEVLLQDYDQMTLLPLTGGHLVVGRPQPIAGSRAGQAFRTDTTVEQTLGGGVRLFVPLLDGTDRVGVLAFTLDAVDDHDRRLTRRLAGLVADILITKGMYTDQLFQARRRRPMSLSAEMQWQLLPPLMMTTPEVAVAGALEPAYDVAGDSFDYALNDTILHVAVIDAMGPGLGAALLATLAVGAYRHARRFDVGLDGLYAAMDQAIADQFGPDKFVTAQMARLDVTTGVLQWVNAGHPAPLLLRGGVVVAELESPTTLPVGFGGAKPLVTTRALELGDRVLFFTDGVIEEDRRISAGSGMARLKEVIEGVGNADDPVQETVRLLSSALMQERGGVTTDDATLLLVEWRGGTSDHLALNPGPRM